ncbi:hypothetical protein ACWCXC_17240 [Streptomyces sp. NPDC001515]
MSHRTVYPSVIYAALVLVVGLTVLITGVLTSRVVGPTIITGTITTLLGVIATTVTGHRAATAHIHQQIHLADSAALAKEIIRHDTTVTTAPIANRTVVELGARRPRENTT